METLSRWTLWEDDRGDVRQLSLALLDARSWDMLREITHRAGPFDTLEELQERLRVEMQAWVETYGLQGELELS